MQRQFESGLENDSSAAEVKRITWGGVWTNIVLVALKFTAGVAGHSSVLVADAVHSLSDLITDAAVLIGVKFWNQPADSKHPYGHKKIETLITLFIGAALVVVGLGLLFGAVDYLINILHGYRPPSPTWLPFAAAIISIAVKEYLYRITVKAGMSVKSSALLANAWHHRSDALSSIPAAAAVGMCLLFGKEYIFLDPVGTIVVAFMIVHAAWYIIYPTFESLLDSGVSESQCNDISAVIHSFSEVQGTHKLRTRYAGSHALAVDVHIQVAPNMSVMESHALSHKIQQKLLQSGRHIIDVFIHIEPAQTGG